MSNLENVNLQDVRQKLYERLKPSGWGDKLKGFLLSNDFDSILQTLYKEAKDNKRFTPVVKQLFRAFEECPYNDLKVICIGQDPYPYPPPGNELLPIADGIAFSSSNDGKVPASLRYMFKEIEDTVYPNEGYIWDPDLARWSKQGILMLNIALTTTINKVGQHYLLWQPFLAYLFDILNFTNPGLIYVFMGRKAQEWSKSIPDNNWKLTCSHPASAAHQNLEKWDSGDIFNQISALVENNFKQKIIW
jgi:uracil-DNA glycosylase